MAKPKVSTASEAIDELGGTTKVATLCGVLPSAVSNWRRTGFPPRLHYRLARILEARGVRVAERLFNGGAA